MTGLGSTANTQEQILQKNDLKRKKKQLGEVNVTPTKKRVITTRGEEVYGGERKSGTF